MYYKLQTWNNYVELFNNDRSEAPTKITESGRAESATTKSETIHAKINPRKTRKLQVQIKYQGGKNLC